MVNMVIREGFKAIILCYAGRTVPLDQGGQWTESLQLQKPDDSGFPLAMHIQFPTNLIHLCKLIWPL